MEGCYRSIILKSNLLIRMERIIKAGKFVSAKLLLNQVIKEDFDIIFVFMVYLINVYVKYVNMCPVQFFGEVVGSVHGEQWRHGICNEALCRSW